MKAVLELLGKQQPCVAVQKLLMLLLASCCCLVLPDLHLMVLDPMMMMFCLLRA
jgi:hypothetical protein